MTVVRTVLELAGMLAPHRGGRIGFVPTMGALHDGHVALMRPLARTADWLVASLFVNPKQFNDPTDLARYPRQEARDVGAAAAAGADLLFAPTVDEIYPPGHATDRPHGRPGRWFDEGVHGPAISTASRRCA